MGNGRSEKVGGLSGWALGDVPGYPGAAGSRRGPGCRSPARRPRAGGRGLPSSYPGVRQPGSGDGIVHVGHGGRDRKTGKRAADQNLDRGNRALAVSGNAGLLVRVVRGAGHPSPYAPGGGHRHDGLYRVYDYRHDAGARVPRAALPAPPPARRERPGTTAGTPGGAGRNVVDSGGRAAILRSSGRDRPPRGVAA